MSDEATIALNQAVTCLNNGSYDLAIEKCGEAIRRHGADAAAFYLRAVAHRASGDYARASADVGEARRLAPAGAIAGLKETLGWQLGNAIGFYNRGSAYHNERDYDRAINNYSEAVRLDRAYTAAHLGRAVAFETRDRNNPHGKRYDERYGGEPDCDRAMRDYRMVLALDADAAAKRIAKAGLDRLLAQEAGVLKLK
jgi:tetratricopeptide (TPR) repeat protein